MFSQLPFSQLALVSQILDNRPTFNHEALRHLVTDMFILSAGCPIYRRNPSKDPQCYNSQGILEPCVPEKSLHFGASQGERGAGGVAEICRIQRFLFRKAIRLRI